MNGPTFLAGASSSGKTLLRLALSSHPYKLVRCEALTSHFEETLRDVCAFLGERFLYCAIDWPANLAGMAAWRVLMARQ